MSAKKHLSNNNYKIVVIFLATVLFFIGISFAIKIWVLYNQSTFHPSYAYTLLFQSHDPSAYIVSFTPQKRTISILSVSQAPHALKALQQILALPIDGYVIFPKPQKVTAASLDMTLFSLLTQYHTVKTNLTLIDLARLMMYTKSIQNTEVFEERLDLPQSQAQIDKTMQALFAHPEITGEKVSIEVINGSDVPGMGARVARAVNNSGGYVIAVTSSDTEVARSQILYSGEKNYTLTRLAKILSFPVKKRENTAIADITIIIGKDRVEKIAF